MDHFLHAVQGINGARMPSPFNEKSVHDLIDSLAQPDGINFGPNGLKKKKPEKNPDRRLPMLERVIGSGNSYSKIPLHELERKKKEFIGWDHMQFLGENMVGLLSSHLCRNLRGLTDYRLQDSYVSIWAHRLTPSATGPVICVTELATRMIQEITMARHLS